MNMNISATRTGAVIRKELTEFRRSRFIVSTMGIVPVLFLAAPIANVLAANPAPSAGLDKAVGIVLLPLLLIPVVIPATIAAYSVVGEREQGTLEPVLTTPVRREEFLLGKALACFVPSVAISYAVYCLLLTCVEIFGQPAVTSALVRGPDLLAQLIFTPLLAG